MTEGMAMLRIAGLEFAVGPFTVREPVEVVASVFVQNTATHDVYRLTVGRMTERGGFEVESANLSEESLVEAVAVAWVTELSDAWAAVGELLAQGGFLMVSSDAAGFLVEQHRAAWARVGSR